MKKDSLFMSTTSSPLHLVDARKLEGNRINAIFFLSTRSLATIAFEPIYTCYMMLTDLGTSVNIFCSKMERLHTVHLKIIRPTNRMILWALKNLANNCKAG